jgi:chemotaxis methyl-accepting protein methylase
MDHRSMVMLAAETVSGYVKTIPGVRQALRSQRAQRVRYWLALHFEQREHFTFTQFQRLPAQFEALTGPVLDVLRAPTLPDPLRIVVLGCSTGAEPYSISSALLARFPDLSFTINAYDIDERVLEVAARATYTEEAVLAHRLITPDFIASTFDRDAGQFTVKRHIANRVRFGRADLLDPALASLIPPADIVCLQNVLCNMSRSMARRAFQNTVALLKPRSVLLVDGMDPDMRAAETRAANLTPLSVALERIHDEARVIRGERYPWYATGLEPFSAERRDRDRRYATIFTAGG